MDEFSKASARPWTPTENPDDNSYASPVVYHGDHQLQREDSDGSSDDDDYGPSIQKVSPTGRDVTASLEVPRPQPLRFRSSQVFRDDAAGEPEAQRYQPYRSSQVLDNAKLENAQSLRPQQSSQAPNSEVDERLPENNPYRVSRILAAKSSENLAGLASKASSPIVGADAVRQSSANNPYRLSQAMRSESTEGLLIKPHRVSQAQATSKEPPRVSQSPHEGKAELVPSVRQQRLSRAPRIEADDDLPSVSGSARREIKILLINPNSTKSMTDSCLESIATSLPEHVTVYGFTPSRPAPTAIESQTDAIISTAACIKAILPLAARYDAFLVACFSHHPLITALREQLMQPVIGIMEASLYAARMCGAKFGVLTTGMRSMYLQETSVGHAYGLGDFFVGAESSRMGVLELKSRTQEEVEGRLAMAAQRLQARGADCICLGCAGMTDLRTTVEGAVGMHDRVAMVIDGVAVGVHFLIGLVRENLGTAKGMAHNTSSRQRASGSGG